MTYLHHRVPPDMQGNVLYPLYELQEKFPKLYDTEVAKYRGRERVMSRRVPILNCKWNDVLHLSPVYPGQADTALRKLGRPINTRKFFQIDSHLLEQERTIVYLHREKTPAESALPENWAAYDPDDVAQYSELPLETISYYEEAVANNDEMVFLWNRVPHILYRGSIDVSGCSIVEI